MNQTRQLIATATLAASALFSAGAFAQEATPDTWTAVHSSQTRAAVVADLAVAGQANVWTEGYIEPVRASTVLRADVRQLTLQAIRSGEVKAINAEVAGVSPAAVQAMRNAG